MERNGPYVERKGLVDRLHKHILLIPYVFNAGGDVYIYVHLYLRFKKMSGSEDNPFENDDVEGSPLKKDDATPEMKIDTPRLKSMLWKGKLIGFRCNFINRL